MDIQFKKVELTDRELINSYLRLQKTRSCEMTFANIYLWSRFYHVEFAVAEDMLIFHGTDDPKYFEFPVGKREGVKPAMDLLLAYCEERGIAFRLGLVTPGKFEILEELYPGKFQIEYDRDSADYVYETEKLAQLSGKKYHGKKNHINKFQRLYPDWQYESISASNVEECFQMALEWRHANVSAQDEEKNAEVAVTQNALRLFEELGLRGGLLRAGGRVAAFTIGEPVCDDTMVVHIEKAFADVEGAYTMINWQFILHEALDYTYVNREEDLGDPGLRKAKLSYHPAFLEEKGVVTLR